MNLLSWSSIVPRISDGVMLRLLQDRRSGPLLNPSSGPPALSVLSLLAGHGEGQGLGWTVKRTRQGWSRRARESPAQVLKPGRTQLSQDLGGASLAIDTLPDNRTRVVVSCSTNTVGEWSWVLSVSDVEIGMGGDPREEEAC